jgi:hypothetical protein
MLTWRSAFVVVAIVAAILDATPAASVTRATEWSAQSRRPPRTRVEIRPGPLFHRECVDGLQVSHKYPGRRVLMPYLRCWWVRG